MEDKQILELILGKLESIDSRLERMEVVQVQQGEQIQIIKEQTARNAELESTVKEHSVDILKIKDDMTLIKRLLAN